MGILARSSSTCHVNPRTPTSAASVQLPASAFPPESTLVCVQCNVVPWAAVSLPESCFEGADLPVAGLSYSSLRLQLHTTSSTSCHEALHPEQRGKVCDQRAPILHCGDTQGRVHRFREAGGRPWVHLPNPPRQGACSWSSLRAHPPPHHRQCPCKHPVDRMCHHAMPCGGRRPCCAGG